MNISLLSHRSTASTRLSGFVLVSARVCVRVCQPKVIVKTNLFMIYSALRAMGKTIRRMCRKNTISIKYLVGGFGAQIIIIIMINCWHRCCWRRQWCSSSVNNLCTWRMHRISAKHSCTKARETTSTANIWMAYKLHICVNCVRGIAYSYATLLSLFISISLFSHFSDVFRSFGTRADDIRNSFHGCHLAPIYTAYNNVITKWVYTL